MARVLESGWLAQGAVTMELERQFVERLGGGAACAVASGTAGLFMALTAIECSPATRL